MLFFLSKSLFCILGAQKNRSIEKFFLVFTVLTRLEAVSSELVVFAYTFFEIIHYSGAGKISFVKYFYIHLIFLYELYISNSMDPGQTA